MVNELMSELQFNTFSTLSPRIKEVDIDLLRIKAKEIVNSSKYTKEQKIMLKERAIHKMTTSRRRALNKKRLVEIFGGECMNCGYKDCLGALEFHHLNAKEKIVKNHRHVFFASNKFDKLLEESKKCILLCSNCHRMIHIPDLF